MTARIATYEEWRSAKLAELRANPQALVTCPSCDGDGEVECGECGQESECARCEAVGEIPFDDVLESEHWAIFRKPQYHREIKADITDLSRYTGDPVHEILDRNGFHAVYHIRTREPMILERKA